MSAVVNRDAAVTDGRQRIMDAAAALFLRQGYDRTSLRHIAAASDMKAGSVYYHFESKDDLLIAILRRGIAVMVEAFAAVAAELGEVSPRERIGAHVRGHLGALFEHGPYTAAHVTTFHLAPDAVRDETVPDRDGYEALWSELLEGLGTAGHLGANVDIGLSRLTLFGAMNTTIEWFDPDRSSLDRLADTITTQFWTGVAAEEARR